jgi:hypothetical protein
MLFDTDRGHAVGESAPRRLRPPHPRRQRRAGGVACSARGRFWRSGRRRITPGDRPGQNSAKRSHAQANESLVDSVPGVSMPMLLRLRGREITVCRASCACTLICTGDAVQSPASGPRPASGEAVADREPFSGAVLWNPFHRNHRSARPVADE